MCSLVSYVFSFTLRSHQACREQSCFQVAHPAGSLQGSVGVVNHSRQHWIGEIQPLASRIWLKLWGSTSKDTPMSRVLVQGG